MHAEDRHVAPPLMHNVTMSTGQQGTTVYLMDSVEQATCHATALYRATSMVEAAPPRTASAAMVTLPT
jgi:hypothetical protein